MIALIAGQGQRNCRAPGGFFMNTIEMAATLHQDPKWIRFAEKLRQAMTDEFNLDGVTVFLRELTAEEIANNESEVLTFSQDRQSFEFGVSPTDHPPTAWKVADRIDHFLNPDVELED
jgi:hypothetical protein